MKEQGGQGSLEYLLIIGGGILIAVIIIGVVVPLANTSGSGNQGLFAQGQCKAFTKEQCNLQTLQIGEDYFICQFDYTQKECTAKKVDEIITDCKESGWEEGKVYLADRTLTGTSAVCIVINVPNTTFSCGGNTIVTTNSAIDAKGLNNITIQNCIIEAAQFGILIGGDYSKILNNTIHLTDLGYSGRTGISVGMRNPTENMRIEGNTITIENPKDNEIAIDISDTAVETTVKDNRACDNPTGQPDYYSIKIESDAGPDSGNNACPPERCYDYAGTNSIICNISSGNIGNCPKSC